MRHLLMLLALTATVPSNVPAADSREAAIVDSLLSAAADTSLEIRARLDLAKKAVDHGRTGRSMHALALLYMVEGEHSSLSDAERWLGRAARKDKANADYQATYAEIYWIWNRRSDAYKRARKAIDMDPDNVRALHVAGQYQMWQMTRYLDAEQVDRTYDEYGRVIERVYDLSRYGEEARDQAIGLFSRALAVDPEHWPTRRDLGLVYYEARMYGDVVSLFKEFSETHPGNSDGHFFLGLGYQDQDRPTDAYAAYVRGLGAMSEKAQRFMMAVFLVGEGADDPDAENAPDMRAIRKFWTGRDPLFMTPVNERLMEHCRRVAYANLRFASDRTGTPGWSSDRGQAYIRYGQPVSRTANPAQIHTGVDQPGWFQDYLYWQAQDGTSPIQQENRKEVWAYEGFVLVFDNPDMKDSWRFRIALAGRYPFGFEDFVERVPERYTDPYHWERYDAPYQIAQFRAPEGETRLEIYYALTGEHVAHSIDRPGLATVNLRQGLYIFDSNWDTVRNRTEPVRALPIVSSDGYGEGYLFIGDRLSLPPGGYLIAGEAEDQKTRSLGTFRKRVAVRDFGGDSLQVSSVLLARAVVEREERPFGRDRYVVLPNPIQKCPRDGQAAFYFEIYNLNRDEFGATEYRIDYQMRRLPDVPDPERAAPEWTTAVSYTYNESRDWEPHYLTLDLDGKAPGLWDFRVVVNDLKAKTQSLSSTSFRVHY